jgi:UDP-N-acetyl-2-amino-2-deoxyglucuronate dehydrogenase
MTINLSITGRKIRFGLVGCGRISSNHLQAISNYPDEAEIVALCDIDPVALEIACLKTGVGGFTNLSEMLSSAEMDAVILSTPSGLHSSQASQVARSGRHVITEKPMATRWEDGKQMVTTCDEAGVRLFVVKQNRFNPTIERLKAAVANGRFGRIYMVNVNVFWSRPQSYYDSAKWRGTWEYDGGAFMNQASHYVDLLDWIVGPLESVQAYTATLARNIEVEDTGVVSLKWRSGALGSLNVTMLTYRRNMEGSITIIGEKGTAKLDGIAVNNISYWDFADCEPEDESVKTTNYETKSVYGNGHARYYANVIRSLQGLESPLTDGREGLRSLELLIATYLSARDARRVSLPLEH